MCGPRAGSSEPGAADDLWEDVTTMWAPLSSTGPLSTGAFYPQIGFQIEETGRDFPSARLVQMSPFMDFYEFILYIYVEAVLCVMDEAGGLGWGGGAWISDQMEFCGGIKLRLNA